MAFSRFPQKILEQKFTSAVDKTLAFTKETVMLWLQYHNSVIMTLPPDFHNSF